MNIKTMHPVVAIVGTITFLILLTLSVQLLAFYYFMQTI